MNWLAFHLWEERWREEIEENRREGHDICCTDSDEKVIVGRSTKTSKTEEPRHEERERHLKSSTVLYNRQVCVHGKCEEIVHSGNPTSREDVTRNALI